MSHYLFLDDSRIEAPGISSIGGLLVDDVEYSRLLAEFHNIKKRHLGDHDAPIKWNPPGDDSDFDTQRSCPTLTELRNDVCDLLGSTNGMLLFACLDELGFRYDKAARKKFLLLCLEYLCQRTQMQMSSINGRATVIADVPGTDLLTPMSKRYARLIKAGSTMPGVTLQYTRLNRTLYFASMVACEGLQLADFAIGAFNYHVKGRGDHYLRRFGSKIRRSGAAIKGRGIIVYPQNSTIVDATVTLCASL